MLYNLLIRSKGQTAAVSEHTSMMAVPDFFTVGEWKKNKPEKWRGHYVEHNA